MKLPKILTIFIALFIFFNIYITVAIAGNIENDYFYETTTNQPLNNVKALVYKCTDDNCSNVDLTPGRFEKNSGSTNKISIEFLGTSNPTRYAEYFYRTGYLPLETTVEDWGMDHEFNYYDNTFNKLNYCSSAIDSFYVINEVNPNEPIQIDVQASLGANTSSAFSRPNIRPFYIPQDQDIRDEFYSAKTNVNVKILNRDNRVVFEDEELLNLYLDTKKSVRFTWTPTTPGRYRAQLTTTVIDDQCNQDNDIPQQAVKVFKVLENLPILSCYTQLNELDFSDLHPIENQPIKIFVKKITNFIENDLKTPVATESRLRITKEGTLVFEQTKFIPQNSNPNDFIKYDFDWNTLSKGLYNIIVDAEAEDPRCSNRENTPDHIETTLLVREGQQPPIFNLNIEEINDQEVIENSEVRFSLNVQYNGNSNLIYNVEGMPNGAKIENNIFTWTPDYETVSHNIINQLMDVIGIQLKKEFNLEFKVTDGILNDSEKVKITVFDKNRNPKIENAVNLEVVEGDPINLSKILIITDQDNDHLKVNFSYPFNQYGEWQTKIGDVGLYNILVTAQDPFNGFDQASFRVLVKKFIVPNQPPFFENLNDQKVKAGDTLRFTVKAQDKDNDKLTYWAIIDDRAAWAEFNNSNQEFYWNTRIGQEGTYDVEFFVTDGIHEVSKKIKIIVFNDGIENKGDDASHKFSISSLIVENPQINSNEPLEVFVRIRNYGTTDEKITLRLQIKELGIRETKTFAVDEKTTELKVISFMLPADSPNGNYILEAKAFNRFWHSIKHTEFDII